MIGSPSTYRPSVKWCLGVVMLLLAQGLKAETEPQIIPSFGASFYWTESTYAPGQRFATAQEACLHLETSTITDCSFVNQNLNGMAAGPCHCYRPYFNDWVNLTWVIQSPDCSMYPNTQYEYGSPQVADGVCRALYHGCRNDSWKHDPNAGICSRGGDPKGNGQSCLASPAPIVFGTGNKFLVEIDIPAAARDGVSLQRTYNSNGTVAAGAFGAAWRATGMQRIHAHLVNGQHDADAYREDGKIHGFRRINGEYIPAADIADRLTRLTDEYGATAGWQYKTAANQAIEHYDALGRLTLLVDKAGLRQIFSYGPSNQLAGIEDPLGRAIAFGYDAQNRIAAVTDYAGGQTAYTYDANNNLVSVTYPNGAVRQYHYENATFKNALTGITDERGVRYITYTYDAEGKAVGEVMTGGVGSYGLAFGTNQTTVTDPLGTQRTFAFQTILGVAKNTGQSQPGGSGCGPAAEALTYDANGNVSSRTDFNGKKTTYAYDLTRNLETSRTEGLSNTGTALPETRTITTSWHPTWRLPVEVNEYTGASATGNPLRRTSTAYDDKGNIVSRSVTDVAAGQTRTSTTAYTYSTAVPGLILQKVEDGPRTDVTDTTVTDYYPHDEVCAGAALGTGRDKGCRGQMKRVTNPLGQTTQYTRYNAHGQIEEIVDPNGTLTTLTYDLRQRLTSRTTAGETTAFQYDPVGQLTRLTQPDGSYIAYTYDGARRLTEVADSLGNRIAYTLDAAGNRTREEIRDPQGALAKTLTRAYDALGRMQTLTGVGND